MSRLNRNPTPTPELFGAREVPVPDDANISSAIRRSSHPSFIAFGYDTGANEWVARPGESATEAVDNVIDVYDIDETSIRVFEIGQKSPEVNR